jgi:hypothetical protein
MESVLLLPGQWSRKEISHTSMRTGLFWVITQPVVVISYRRFEKTYRSHPQGSRIQKAHISKLRNSCGTSTAVQIEPFRANCVTRLHIVSYFWKKKRRTDVTQASVKKYVCTDGKMRLKASYKRTADSCTIDIACVFVAKNRKKKSCGYSLYRFSHVKLMLFIWQYCSGG